MRIMYFTFGTCGLESGLNDWIFLLCAYSLGCGGEKKTVITKIAEWKKFQECFRQEIGCSVQVYCCESSGCLFFFLTWKSQIHPSANPVLKKGVRSGREGKRQRRQRGRLFVLAQRTQFMNLQSGLNTLSHTVWRSVCWGNEVTVRCRRHAQPGRSQGRRLESSRQHFTMLGAVNQCFQIEEDEPTGLHLTRLRSVHNE